MTDAFVRSRMTVTAEDDVVSTAPKPMKSLRRGLNPFQGPSEGLVLEPLPVQGDLAARFPLAPGHLLHIQREVDGAHDPIAEHLIRLLPHRIAVDTDDFH